MIKIVSDKYQFLIDGGSLKSVNHSDTYLNVNLTQVFDERESVLIALYLEQTVEWTISSVKRVNCTYGDDGLVYEIKFGGYGGRPLTIIKRKAIPWTEVLNILNKISTLLTRGVTSYPAYNFCVAMCYPTGKIGINHHKDKEMTKGTTICGWSFCSERTLTMGHPKYIDTSNISINLPPGSMYEFVPPTNDHWTHCIEKDNTKEKRISLTFRNYKSSGHDKSLL